MWQIYYSRALEIARERAAEAARDRLARPVHEAGSNRSRIDGLRRSGALVAAGIARRLDECVAREALTARALDDGVGLRG
jgi:hypothetical protein